MPCVWNRCFLQGRRHNHSLYPAFLSSLLSALASVLLCNPTEVNVTHLEAWKPVERSQVPTPFLISVFQMDYLEQLEKLNYSLTGRDFLHLLGQRSLSLLNRALEFWPLPLGYPAFLIKLSLHTPRRSQQ